MQQLLKKAYVKPVEKSMPFFKAHNAQVVTERVEKGKEPETIKKPFLNSFLPETTQVIGPHFSSKQGKRRYSFKGTDVELKEWVAKLGLRYEEWHPKAGELIESSSWSLYGDPFFEHATLRRNMKEGHVVLDPGSVNDQFLFMCLIDHPDFSNAFDDKETRMNKKFMITDKLKEIESLSANRMKDSLAEEAFRKLEVDKEQLERVCKILNLTSGVHTNWEETKNNLYYKFVRSHDKVADDGRTKQDVFMKVLEMNDKDMDLRLLIKEGEQSGSLRYVKNKGYMFNDEMIATNKVALFAFFKKADNAKLLSKMQEALGT